MNKFCEKLKEIYIKTSEQKLTNIICYIIAIICIVLMAYSYTQKSFQNDTFYTIKIGELITQNGIDMQDHFSSEDLPYTYPHWLFDFIVYQIYNTANTLGFDGYTALYITTIILTITLGLSLFYIIHKKSGSKILSLILTLFSIYMLRGFLALRAQIVTFNLYIWAYYFIDNIATQKEFNIKYAIGLVLISLAVANLHCATWPFLFILFLPYIGQYLLYNIENFFAYSKYELWDLNNFLKRDTKRLEKLKQKDPSLVQINMLENKIVKINARIEKIQKQNEKIKEKKKANSKNTYKIEFNALPNAKKLLIIMVVCALMGFVTPIGFTPFTYLYDTMRGTTTQNINEHLPMTLSEYTDEWLALALLIALLAFTKVKISLYNLFMLAGLSVLMLMSRRQLTFFVLIGSPIFATLCVNALNGINKDGSKVVDKYLFSTTVLVLILIICTCICVRRYRDLKDEPYIYESDYPVNATKWIKQNLDVENIKLYNEYNYGSYLLLNDIPVFIDSRADLYAPEFNGKDMNIFGDFMEVSSLSTWYDDIFDKYDFTHFIIYSDNKVSMVIEHLDSNYIQIYKDDYFCIYEKANLYLTNPDISYVYQQEKEYHE